MFVIITVVVVTAAVIIAKNFIVSLLKASSSLCVLQLYACVCLPVCVRVKCSN